jgi:D-ribose pyranose/furanose isomerase RbsD
LEKQIFTRANEINSENKPLKEKLIGLKFSMEDQKAIAMEAHNTIVTMEKELKLIL